MLMRANIFNNLISDPERLLSWVYNILLNTGFIVAKGVRSGIETAVLRLMFVTNYALLL